MKKIIAASFCTVLAMVCLAGTAYADETSGRNYGPKTFGQSIDEYSRLGSTAEFSRTMVQGDLSVCSQPGITCQNFVPATALASVWCDGNSSGGGWTTTQVGGKCWTSVDVCDVNGANCVTKLGPDITPDDVIFANYSKCLAPKPKNYCDYNYVGGLSIRSNTAAAGDINVDDMFRLNNSTDIFFEYMNVTYPDRLRWISRNGGANANQGLMIPSGPADYKQFIKNPPAMAGSGLTIEEACYPVTVSISCAQPAVPGVAGICGAATLAAPGTYATLASIPAGAFCNVGAPIGSSENATQITWTCSNAGNNSPLCTVSKLQDGVCGPAASAPINTYNSGPPPAAFLCTVGTAVGVTSIPTGTTWTCNGINGGGPSPLCTAPTNDGPAVCGSANGKTYPDLASIPAASLCAPGNAFGPRDDVSGITPNFWWSCTDINGSFPSVQCGATKGVGPPPPPPEVVCTPGDTAQQAGPNWVVVIDVGDPGNVGDPTMADCYIRSTSQTLVCEEVSPNGGGYMWVAPALPGPIPVGPQWFYVDQCPN